MTENDLIRKIRTLEEIKPNKDWAVFSKNQILNSEPFEKQSNSSFMRTFSSEFFFIFGFFRFFHFITTLLINFYLFCLNRHYFFNTPKSILFKI